jgi:hypothetical protein
MNGSVGAAWRRAQWLSTVRAWCSATVSPVRRSMAGSHIQSCGLAHTSLPTTAW